MWRSSAAVLPVLHPGVLSGAPATAGDSAAVLPLVVRSVFLSRSKRKKKAFRAFFSLHRRPRLQRTHVRIHANRPNATMATATERRYVRRPVCSVHGTAWHNRAATRPRPRRALFFFFRANSLAEGGRVRRRRQGGTAAGAAVAGPSVQATLRRASRGVGLDWWRHWGDAIGAGVARHRASLARTRAWLQAFGFRGGGGRSWFIMRAASGMG